MAKPPYMMSPVVPEGVLADQKSPLKKITSQKTAMLCEVRTMGVGTGRLRRLRWCACSYYNGMYLGKCFASVAYIYLS